MATSDKGAVETSTELEFCLRDSELFFITASGQFDCHVALVEMIQRSDSRLLEFFIVRGAVVEEIRSLAAESPYIDNVRLISTADDSLLFEFVVSGPCIGRTLADAGAVIREVTATEGTGRVVADVPAHVRVRSVVETVSVHHDAELVARRERDHASLEFTRGQFRSRLADQLTDRQLETLKTAFAAGYFDWPRESTAEECAAALGITQPTFTEHIRAAEQKLIRMLFVSADGTMRSD